MAAQAIQLERQMGTPGWRSRRRRRGPLGRCASSKAHDSNCDKRIYGGHGEEPRIVPSVIHPSYPGNAPSSTR
eukprot:5659687-Pleurochrysis_carterae.AAC.1